MVIRCYLCGHRGEAYTDVDGACCNKCGHEHFEEIEADETQATARESCAADLQILHRKSKIPELEVIYE